jgi:T4 bacteriophage base plate protein
MNEETIAITRPTVPAVNTKPSQQQESTYPTEMIDLPSNGYFYKKSNKLSSGKVELKMMTAKEEDILTNENLLKKGEVLNKLLDSLIVDKDINSNDLLVGDKNALFVAARRLAYGDNYGPLQITCKNCKEDSEISINLADIKSKDYNFELHNGENNIFSFILPYSKKTIEYKLPTAGDERNIDAELKSIAKLNKSNSAEITTRLKYLITSVNGNNETAYIRKFVDTELLSRDSIALRNDIRKNAPDLDLTFDFICEHCNNSERMDVPMTAQFFWPTS